MRAWNETEAKKLGAGSKHYTAHAGPPGQSDFMGASEFRLLCALGLRDHHRLLDFGCGSLRAGRLLIPYLQPGRYFGIEPNRGLVEDAIAIQIGQDLVRIKHPQFSHSEAFTAGVFAETFDFIVAQNTFSHAGPKLVAGALASFTERLHPDGICAVTFLSGGSADVENGWTYPGCVKYRREAIDALIRGASLVGMAIPWFHPRQTWFVLARQAAALPTAGEARLLNGAVLRSQELRTSVLKPIKAMKLRRRQRRTEQASQTACG